MISCIYTRIADSINMMFVYLFVCIVMYLYKVFFGNIVFQYLDI